jgi:predicted RNA polymerase sigma factor
VWARRGASRTLVLLADQNRMRWDRLLIRRGFAELGRAHALNHRQHRPPGRYALQAAIAAAHAMAATPEATDWRRIAGLYAVLAQRFPSPIVELNRAVAVAMAATSFRHAAELTANVAEQHLLRNRADACVNVG